MDSNRFSRKSANSESPTFLTRAAPGLVPLSIDTGQGGIQADLRGAVYPKTSLPRRATHRRLLVLEPAVSAGESRRRLMHSWARATTLVIPASMSIPERFELQASRCPDSIAVVSSQRSLTYAELEHFADTLAAHLRQRGVQPGDLVGVLLPRSIEAVAALLAILKAGAAYVPLEPDLPTDRLAFMVEDTGTQVLLTHSETVARCELPGVELLCVDQLGALPKEHAELEQGSIAAADPLAYVMYTSGSTGKPKGVEIPHRGVMRLVVDADYIAMTDRSVVLQAAPLAFDASTFEIWGPLLNGGRLVLYPLPTLDLHGLGNVIREFEINTLWLTAGLFHAMVDEHVDALAPLETLLAGGDVLSPDHVRRCLKAHPQLKLVNGYGPTENTTFTCCHAIQEADLQLAAVPIGKPIRGTQVYVLDEHQSLVQDGERGELYVGGDGVALGYLNRPALTRQQFIGDTFGDQPGKWLYKTGDLVRRDSAGVLHFLGRIDDQVKIRGYRIEPGEVAHAIRDCEGVREAVVLVEPSASGDKQLAAYIQVDAERYNRQALQQTLRAELPHCMQPRRLVEVDEFPLTPNGKVDRRLLAKLSGGQSDRPRAAPTVWSATEQRVRAAFADILGENDLTPTDHFLALGGDSLSAMRVVARLSSETGRTLTLSEFLKDPTIAGFARCLAAGTNQVSPRPALSRVSRAQRLPLSACESRMLFLDRLLQNRATYNVPLAFRLCGPLDANRLQQALQTLVARHEILRTTFHGDEQGTYRRICRPADTNVFIERVDLRPSQPPQRCTAGWKAKMQRAADQPFDLCQGPLIRACLYQIGDAEFILLINFHHIICDQWSLRMLIREWGELYASGSEDEPQCIKTAEMADYAVWDHSLAEQPLCADSLDFWNRVLEGLPQRQTLAFERPTRDSVVATGDRWDFEWDASLLDAIRGLAKQVKQTPNTVLLASFAWILAGSTGNREVVVGSPYAQREQPETAELLGCLLNTLPIRIQTAGVASFRELLQVTQTAYLAAVEHAHVPFDKIVRCGQPSQHSAETPYTNVMFVLLDGFEPQFGLPGIQESAVELQSTTAKFDLTLFLNLRANCISGALEFRSDRFGRGDVSEFVQQLHALISQAVMHPDAQLEASGVQCPAAVPLSGSEQAVSQAGGTASSLRHPSESEPASLLQAELEDRLGTIWRDLLGKPEIAVDEDFFDLGGHSLLAIRLAARLRKELDVDVAIANIMTTPTIRSLAQWLVGGQAPSHSRLLVELRSNQSSQISWVIPGLLATPLAYRQIAREIRSDWSVLGVDTNQLANQPVAPNSIEQIASCLLEPLFEDHSVDDYVLIGHSIGGIIAFEMARQLELRGTPLRRIVMLDSYAPGFPPRLPPHQRLRLHLQELAGRSVQGRMQYLGERVARRWAQTANKLGIRKEVGPADAFLPSELTGFKATQLQAMHAYMQRCTPIRTDISVIRAANAPDWPATVFDDDRLGWFAWTSGQIESYTTPGDHLSMLNDEYAAELGDILSRILSGPSA